MATVTPAKPTALGSAARRAAARALMEKREETRFCLWLRVVGKDQIAAPRIKRFDGGMGFIYGAGFENYDPECTEIYRGPVSKRSSIYTRKDGPLGGHGAKMSKTSFANGTTNRITRACGIILLWAVAAVALPAQTLKTLHTFGNTDGASPNGGLIQATDGNLYGTTAGGGLNTNDACTGYHYTGCGTVFRITPSGALTTLHSFDFTDGDEAGGLVQGTDGNFYGTSVFGGTGVCGVVNADGCGTVFKMTPSGTLTTLYSFDRTNAHGTEPVGALAQDTDGTFYGSTGLGPPRNGMCYENEGCGTIFSLSAGLGPFVATQPSAGTIGMDVNILGTGLTGATKVTFHGIAATFTVISGSLITSVVPDGATTGTVKVLTPTGTLKSNIPFTVLP